MNYPTPKGDRKYSFAEYMEIEETSIERHDYYHGELINIGGWYKKS